MPRVAGIVSSPSSRSGMVPVTKASGKSRVVHFRFSCNKLMRHAAYWLAFVSLNRSEWRTITIETNGPEAQPSPGTKGSGRKVAQDYLCDVARSQTVRRELPPGQHHSTENAPGGLKKLTTLLDKQHRKSSLRKGCASRLCRSQLRNPGSVQLLKSLAIQAETVAPQAA